MGKVSLVINDNGRIISIPFKDINSLDEFTVYYDNYLELVASLNELLDLGIEDIINTNVRCSYRYKTRSYKYLQDNLYAYVDLPIKYRIDNFNFNSVRDMYAKFYKDDHERIMMVKDGIRNVSTNAIKSYLAGNDISDRDIDIVVKAYFNGSYKKYRNAYYLLTRMGYKVKIDNLSKGSKQELIYNKDQEIINELLLRVKNGNMSNEEMLDYLANNYDIEELSKMFKKEKREEKEEMLALEALTGQKYNELYSISRDKNGKTR